MSLDSSWNGSPVVKPSPQMRLVLELSGLSHSIHVPNVTEAWLQAGFAQSSRGMTTIESARGSKLLPFTLKKFMLAPLTTDAVKSDSASVPFARHGGGGTLSGSPVPVPFPGWHVALADGIQVLVAGSHVMVPMLNCPVTQLNRHSAPCAVLTPQPTPVTPTRPGITLRAWIAGQDVPTEHCPLPV
jgi:hypothetical protein